MKIRLWGTADEVAIVANLLREYAEEQDGFEIVAESDDYKDRLGRDSTPSKLVRRYLEIRI